MAHLSQVDLPSTDLLILDEPRGSRDNIREVGFEG